MQDMNLVRVVHNIGVLHLLALLVQHFYLLYGHLRVQTSVKKIKRSVFVLLDLVVSHHLILITDSAEIDPNYLVLKNEDDSVVRVLFDICNELDLVVVHPLLIKISHQLFV